MLVAAKKSFAALALAAALASAPGAPSFAQYPPNAPPPRPSLPDYLAPYYPPYQPPYYRPRPYTHYVPYPLSLLAVPLCAAVLPLSLVAGYGPCPYAP